MANISKLFTFLLGVIFLGALAPTAFGYFTNITDSLTTAGYGWAAVLIILGIVVGLVYMFIPRGRR